ncbi:hypothetical protein MWU75_11435 [Ornithinimicrobium sp. F0845]|uniref:hypothetical protein n=1 Tax=Ornithinimicrobium sp. F0845 TaxID=2926412 RepID=UPI001FF0EBD1|nr:hypothetical protein [Ornithinimicrobium sp. F0845]MCK0112753.1 hypothetical protein [Ornithinimicrobium sp. F0845]
MVDLTASPYLALTTFRRDGGPELAGTARVLPDDRSRAARRALGRKYGWRFQWFRLVLLLSRARKRGGRPVLVAVDLERPGRAGVG